MFINKINGLQNHQVFKGYQHKIDDYGEQIYEFNYPYDPTVENCYVEIFKVKRNEKAYGGYDVVDDKYIAREKLSPTGTQISIQEKTLLDPDEAFAYRIVKESLTDGSKMYFADSGLKIGKDNALGAYSFNLGDKDLTHTLVSRKSTTPMVTGSGIAVFPDALPGFKVKGFNDRNTGDITYDPELQEEMSNVLRTYSNLYGGNIAGLIAMADYMKDTPHTNLFANPFANGDNISSHHYWNKNNFRIAKEMGSLNDFRTLSRKLFQNGKRLIFDYTLTGEGLEGINFQYAMRWKNHNPETKYWFRMNDSVSYGIIPKNHENLRFKVINPLEIYEQTKDGQLTIKKNLNYDPRKETYFQIYDDSQVSEEQRLDITKLIRAYENIETKNELAINSHDDTIVPFAFQIPADAYSRRLHAVKELIEKDGQKIDLNSAEGTKIIAQFDNLKLAPKVETGTVNFDANTDLIKKRHDVSAFDERELFAYVTDKERIAERLKMEIGANQVTDVDVQTVKYWTKLYKDEHILSTAKTLGKVDQAMQINELIDKGLIPAQGRLSATAVKNIKNDTYLREPKCVDDRDTVTVKNLMGLPLASLELAENTLGVLQRTYFTNQASTEEQIGLTRFELMEMENPHLTEENADIYLKINELFINEIKNFADEVIKLVDEKSPEKLIDEDGEYTEYGEYVMNLIGQDIARYAFLKAIAGQNLESKIRKDGYIEYDVEKLEANTSLANLGIKGKTPKDEARQLERVISQGISNLSTSDIKYVASSISKIIEGTNTLSFRLAEAIAYKSGLGMAGRLDAAKDVMDNDSVREGGNSIDDSIKKIIKYYQHITGAIKSIDPNVPIIAEFTDMAQLFEGTYSQPSQVYGAELLKAAGVFKNVPDAMIQIFNESGITSEAAYSYFFTDLVTPFSREFESGRGMSGHGAIKGKINELLRTRNIDYIRSLYTFLTNHDKPRILQGLALDQSLFYTDFKYSFDGSGKAKFKNQRNHREAAAMVLTGVMNKEDLPLEARLNIDNPEYFKRVSTEGVAMAKLLKDVINENLDGIATPEQIKQMNIALKELANGVYKGEGKVDELQDISIKELSSLESAFTKIVDMAIETHGMKITAEEKADFIKQTVAIANQDKLVSKYVMQGAFDWAGPNDDIGLKNRTLAQTILDRDVNLSSTGSDRVKNNKEYEKYSLYTASVIGLLREAMLQTEKGKDALVQNDIFAAMKDFFEKYDKETVDSSKDRKLFINDKQAIKANSFAAKPLEVAIKMMLEQMEYNTKEQIANKKEISDAIYIPAVEPATVKMQIMSRFLAAVLGMPFEMLGDGLTQTGGERKARNLDLQNRNAIKFHWLNENSKLGDFVMDCADKTHAAFAIRKGKETESLNVGTPYEVSAYRYVHDCYEENGHKKTKVRRDDSFPAYYTQSSNGDANLVIMDTSWVKHGNREVYDEKAENKYNPKRQKETQLDGIEMVGGAAIAAGTVFMNTDPRDTARYIATKCFSKAQGKMVTKFVKELGNINGKVVFNEITAPNGVMILKKIAPSFRGRQSHPAMINDRYNLVSNPYKKLDIPVEGEKLSIISR